MPTTPAQPSETQLPAAQHETEQPNTSPEPQPQPQAQPKAAHPLRSRNFILLVAGQGISLFGNMMLRFAMSMWVLDETGSATAFASILAISFVPMILGAPFGGVLADRMNRRTLMVILDAASAVTVALALVWFSAAGFSIIAVGVMQVALSLLGIFETPTVESALPQMLRQYGDATLNTSAAIVSQVQQVSALIPSFLGGAVYSFFGIRPMMAVSVAAFAGAAAIECFIRLGMPERDEEMPTPLDDLKAALRFLTREKPNLLKMVLLASALNFVVLGYGAVGYAFVIRTQWGVRRDRLRHCRRTDQRRGPDGHAHRDDDGRTAENWPYDEDPDIARTDRHPPRRGLHAVWRQLDAADGARGLRLHRRCHLLMREYHRRARNPNAHARCDAR